MVMPMMVNNKRNKTSTASKRSERSTVGVGSVDGGVGGSWLGEDGGGMLEKKKEEEVEERNAQTCAT